MKIFALLATFALAAANRAKDLMDKGIDALLAGDIPTWKSAFPDESSPTKFTFDFDFRDVDFKYNTHGKSLTLWKEGKDGFTLDSFLEAFGALEIYDLKYTTYADATNEFKALYDSTMYFKDLSGTRYRMGFICKFSTNEDDVLVRASHHAYSLEKIDAKSVADRMLDAWIVGNLEGFFAQVDENVNFDTDIGKSAGDTTMPGNYKGHSGVNDLIAAEVAALDFGYAKQADGKFAINYDHLVSINGGKTAFYHYNIPLKYKTGAAYLQDFKATFTVNDFGKVTDYSFYESGNVQLESAAKQEL